MLFFALFLHFQCTKDGKMVTSVCFFVNKTVIWLPIVRAENVVNTHSHSIVSIRPSETIPGCDETVRKFFCDSMMCV